MNVRKLLLVTSTALCFLGVQSAPAHAAPLAAIIGGLVGGLGTIGTALLGTALSIGANWLIQKIFAEEPKPQGVKQRLDSGGDNPISFIVGKYCTSGKLVYVNAYEENDESLIMVINLSEVPITALSSKIVINGKVCDIDFGNTDSGGFDKVTQYQEDGRNYCSVKFVNDPNTANNYLRNTFGGDPIKPWTNDMIGRGCSYAIIYFGFSTDGIWSGIPTVKFVVQGIPLYDPRKDSSVGGSGPQRWGDRSTHVFTDNNAVVSYNIIRGIRYGSQKIYGGNATFNQLPFDIWAAAMNTCDENVTLKGGGTIDRYTMGAEISVDIPPMDILREIDNSCSGYTFEFGGVWKMFVGGPGASVATITDANIIVSSEQTDDLFKPLQETYNVAQGSYPEPNACWEQKDAPTIYFQEYIDEDGEELSINMEFPFVSEKNQVQRLMRAAVKDSRNQRVHTLELPPPYATLETYDVITWNSTRNGYINKKFLIIQKDDLPNCNQMLVIRETDPTDYDWTTLMELDSEVASLDTPRPNYSRDFTAAASQIDTPSGGKDRPAVYTTWTWAAYNMDIRNIQWEARVPGQTKVQAFGTFDNFRDGNRYVTHDWFKFNQAIEIRFRVQPVSKRQSDWTGWKSVTFAVFDVPAAPTLTARFDTAEDGTNVHYLVVAWTAVTAQTSTYQINLNDGTDDRVYNVSASPAKIPVTSGKTYVVKVAAKDSAGTIGSYSPTTSLLVPKKAVAPTTPAGLTAVGGHRRATLAWTESTDKDYRRTDIYRSTTNDFTTAVVVGSIHGKTWSDTNLALNTTYYYWIIHLDRTYNLSAKFPVSNTAGVAASTTYVLDADTDPTAPAAPAGLTLAQLPRDIDGDGKVDIAFKASWSAATGAKSYEVEVTQGSDVWYIQTKNRSVMIPAKSGFLYSVKVSTITFNGTGSVFSTAVTLTPVKKSALVIAPTSLTVAGGQSRNKLKWSASTETDYKITRIYMSLDATWASATLLDRQAGTAFVDDDLTPGVARRYYVSHVDQSGNESAVFPSNAGAGVLGTPGSVNIGPGTITDAMLDQTAPNVPTALNLVQTAKDLDADGRVDIAIVATWTAPAAGVPVKSYVVEVANGANTVYFQTKKSSYRFEGVVGRTYTVKVSAVSAAGIEGTQTGGVALAPGKKSAAPAAATGLVVTPKAGLMDMVWARCADPDYKETIIFRGGVEIARIKGSAYEDTSNALVIGTSYGYAVQHVDNSGNPGTISSTVNATFRGVLSADLAVAAGGNMVVNSDFSAGLANWGLEYTTDPTKFLFSLRTDTYAPHPGALEIRQIDGVAAHEYGVGPKNADGTPTYYSVIPNAFYELSVYYLGHRCNGVQPYIKWEAWNNTTLVWDHISYTSLGILTANQGINPLKNLGAYVRTPFVKAQAPATATRATIFFRQKGTVTGQADCYLWLHKVYFGQAKANQTEASDWSPAAPNLIGTTNINPGAVTDASTLQTAPGVPTSLAITQAAKDTDADGTVDIAMVATWTAPAGIPPRHYLLEVADGATTVYYHAKKSGLRFKGVVGRTYTTKVQAIAFNGVEGAQSGAVALAPTKKTAAPTAASAPTIVIKANGFWITWPRITDADWKETVVLRGGVEIARVKTNSFFDASNLVVDATYTYSIVHVNNSDIPGAASSGVAATYRLTTSADIAPSTIKLTQLAVPFANNMLLDYDMADKSFWNFRRYTLAGGPGTIVDINKATNVTVEDNPSTSTGLGSSFYRFKVDGTTVTDVIVMESILVPVRRQTEYNLLMYVQNAIASLNVAELYMEFDVYKVDAAGAPVYSFTAGPFTQTQSLGTSTSIKRLRGRNFPSSLTSFIQMRIVIKPTSGNTVIPSYRFGGAVIAQPEQVNELTAASFGQAGNFPNKTFGAAETTVAIIGSSSPGSSIFNELTYKSIFEKTCLLFNFRCRNAGAAARDYTINFYRRSYDIPSATFVDNLLYSIPAYTLRVGDSMAVAAIVNEVDLSNIATGYNDGYVLKMDPSGNANDIRTIDFSVIEMRQ